MVQMDAAHLTRNSKLSKSFALPQLHVLDIAQTNPVKTKQQRIISDTEWRCWSTWLLKDTIKYKVEKTCKVTLYKLISSNYPLNPEVGTDIDLDDTLIPHGGLYVG